MNNDERPKPEAVIRTKLKLAYETWVAEHRRNNDASDMCVDQCEKV